MHLIWLFAIICSDLPENSWRGKTGHRDAEPELIAPTFNRSERKWIEVHRRGVGCVGTLQVATASCVVARLQTEQGVKEVNKSAEGQPAHTHTQWKDTSYSLKQCRSHRDLTVVSSCEGGAGKHKASETNSYIKLNQIWLVSKEYILCFFKKRVECYPL